MAMEIGRGRRVGYKIRRGNVGWHVRQKWIRKRGRRRQKFYKKERHIEKNGGIAKIDKSLNNYREQWIEKKKKMKKKYT